MNINNYENYAEESVIRKKWLISFYVYISPSVLQIVLCGWDDTTFFMCIREAFFMLLLYRFAYEKRGIKFLLWIMISNVISYSVFMFQGVKLINSVAFNYWIFSPILYLYILMPTLVGGYFFFNCYQLLKLNRCVKKQASSSESYVQIG